MIDIDPIQIDLKSYLKIRIEGEPEDIAVFSALLAALLQVSEESRDYPNRGSSRTRRYLTIERRK